MTSAWEDVSDSTVIVASDEIKLDGSHGRIAATVKFVGTLRGKGDTIFYGVELLSSKSKGDGTHNSVRYFHCTPRKGVFLKRNKLKEHRIMNDRMPRISLNDTVKVFVRKGYCQGVVKYVGIPGYRGRNDVYFGIELVDADKGKGDSDGTFNGERYFRTSRNCAYYAKYTTSMVVISQAAAPTSSKKKRSKKGKSPTVRAKKAAGSEMMSELDLGSAATAGDGKASFKAEVRRQEMGGGRSASKGAEDSEPPPRTPPEYDYDSDSTAASSDMDGSEERLVIPPRRGQHSAMTASAMTSSSVSSMNSSPEGYRRTQGSDLSVSESSPTRQGSPMPGPASEHGHVRRTTADVMMVDLKFQISSHTVVSVNVPISFSFKALYKTLKHDLGFVSLSHYELAYTDPAGKVTVLDNDSLTQLRATNPLFYKEGSFALRKPKRTAKTAKAFTLMQNQEDLGAALKLLREEVQDYPDDKEALLAAGKLCCLSKDSFAEAERHFETILGANVRNPEAWVAYGQVLEAGRRFDEAKACYQSAIKHSSLTDELGGVAMLRLRFMEMTIEHETDRISEIEQLKMQVSKLERKLEVANDMLLESQQRNSAMDHAASEQDGSEIPGEEDSDSGASGGLGDHGRTASEELAVMLAPDTPKTKRDQLLYANSMPNLADCADNIEKIDLMIEKLDLCCVICDFNPESQTLEDKQRINSKKDLLTEIVQSMGTVKWSSHSPNSIELLEVCFQTIEKNLFRSFPDEDVPFDQDNEDDMDFKDPCWEHLQLVYELSFHVVTNTQIDKKAMKEKLRGGFLSNLISLFASPDAREPQYVKIIVHAIYGRFMALRKDIRRHLSNYCYHYIYTCTLHKESWQGLPEILEIFCSIFQGLNEPVKPDYRVLLRNVIIPLHKTHHLDEFHDQLLACILQFATKDPESMPVLVGGLLKFWPQSSPLKEQLFLQEFVNLIAIAMKHPAERAGKWKPVLESDGFKYVILKGLELIMGSMKSTHHQVAERATLVWREDCIKRLIDSEKDSVWPKLYNALRWNRDEYWLPTIRNLNKTVLSEMKSRDIETYQDLENAYNERKAAISSSGSGSGSELAKMSGDTDDDSKDDSDDGPSLSSERGKSIRPGMTGAIDPFHRKQTSRKSKWDHISAAAVTNISSHGWKLNHTHSASPSPKVPFDDIIYSR